MFQSRTNCVVFFLKALFLSHVSYCKYLGCFNTNSSTDVLNGVYDKGKHMTIETCCTICSSQGFNVYALQHGEYCYCGTHESDYEILGGAPESACNIPCEGGPSCGGENFMSVYEGKTYVGCYSESFTFGGKVKDLTLEACLDRCNNVYRYFGLKQGNKCYCSDGLPATSSNVSNSKCFEDGNKCRGGDKCGGSEMITVWTNIKNIEKDGIEFVGCYKDPGFQLSQPNQTLADCVHICSINCLYAGINSEKTCFCGDILPPSDMKNVYKTMKLLNTSNGASTVYSLEALCNIANTEYLAVWRLQPAGLANDCYVSTGTWSPSEATWTDDLTSGTVPLDSNNTNAPYTDNDESIPWLKVYPFIISSFFLGCITVILALCLSRSYGSRKIRMQVRKQMEKQGKNNSTLPLQTPRTEQSDSPMKNTDIIEDNATYSSADFACSSTPYDIAQYIDPHSTGYEEVQKKSSQGESFSCQQYIKVDRQDVFDNTSNANNIEESLYSVPKKPALPLNPPRKIIKETKKKTKPKGKSEPTKTKATSRPTYAPPGVQSGKKGTSNKGTETTMPTYSFPTKSIGQPIRGMSTPEEGIPFKGHQNERVEFDYQPKNLIRFKKRSMFGGENVTKSFILNEGSDLSSFYSFPNKPDKRPKSALEMSVKWKNSVKIEFDSLKNESKLENITEHAGNKIPEPYEDGNEYACPSFLSDNLITSEIPSSNSREVADIYHVIDEENVRKADAIYETIEKQAPPLNVKI